ncbi:MAG: DUF805 domain-containing protein [Pseudomonadota bacterium]
MTFVDAVSTCLQKKYVDLKGRASRSEFWWFTLFQLIVLMVAGMVHMGVYGLVALALLLPSLGVGVRRMHDVGRSGWWLLLGFIPLANFVLLYWAVQPGEPAANAWGEPPLPDVIAAGMPPGAV